MKLLSDMKISEMSRTKKVLVGVILHLTCQNHAVPFQMFKRDLDLEHEYNSNTSTAVITSSVAGAKLIVQAGASCQGLRKMPTESHVYSRPCLT